MFFNKNTVTIIVLILLSIFSYFNLNRLIKDVKENSYIINISGMQRMLTEKIAFNSYLLNEQNLDRYRNDLEILIEIMHKNQLEINEFETKNNIKEMHKSSEILNKEVFEYLNVVKNFLNSATISPLTTKCTECPASSLCVIYDIGFQIVPFSITKSQLQVVQHHRLNLSIRVPCSHHLHTLMTIQYHSHNYQTYAMSPASGTTWHCTTRHLPCVL